MAEQTAEHTNEHCDFLVDGIPRRQELDWLCRQRRHRIMGSRRDDELVPDGSLDVTTHEAVNVAAIA